MNIAAEFNDNICVLRPQGRVDTLTAPEVETAVTENAAKCGRLVLDMAEVDYVSSAGIRVIVRAYQVMGKDSFSLRNVSKNVMQLLKMTGFDKVLCFE